MEVKKEGLTAVISIFANVSQFMKSLGSLLESGDFEKLSELERADIIKNIHSVSSFLNETGISLHFMIEDAEGENKNKTN